MLDAGGGGGYGGTNWSSASVMDMWLAVGNQETTPHWQLLSGWRKSYELTLQHMAAVKNYRENLATAWPPDKSPASSAYLGRLDKLIEHLQHTYDAAVANYGAFSNATLALSSARGDLEKVVNEYLANQNKLTAFEAEQADSPSGGLMRRPPVKPPVVDGRQAQLEAQARTIMSGLSTELIQARAQIRQPKPYADSIIEKPDGQEDQGLYTAPPIPPIGSYYPESNAQNSIGPNGHQGTTDHVGSVQSPSPSRGAGLVLGGIQAPPSSPPPMSSIGPPMPSAGQPIVGSPFPSPVTPLLPSGSTPPVIRPSIGATRGTIDGGLRSAVGPGASAAVRAMPPGGVIGTVPNSVPRQPIGTVRPNATINPVGGVISPNNGARVNTAVRPAGQPVGSLTGRGQDSEGATAEPKKWDPDNPWVTAEGVTPVLTPLPEQRIDPGPAIGLE